MRVVFVVLMSVMMAGPLPAGGRGDVAAGAEPLEQMTDGPVAMTDEAVRSTTKMVVERNGVTSVQVNVDPEGRNIVGDAANEPSLAVDPTAPYRLAVGWRQFDRISSNFRQAGRAYSHDGGRTWTAPEVLDPGNFRSDPVLAAAADGRFFYYSLRGSLLCDLYTSDDAGVTWSEPRLAYGGDKAWMAVDTTSGPGRDNLYISWSTASNPWGTRVFTRSVDGGASFSDPITLSPAPIWGTPAVGPDGELYIGGNAAFERNLFVVWRSLDAWDAAVDPTFDTFVADLGGTQAIGDGPNPGGLLGQVWVAVDHSDGPLRGTVYMLSSVIPRDGTDPLDVHLVRSTDGGETWSQPVKVNVDDRGAWQWFATLAVAPNGRLDVVWVESLDGDTPNLGELVYVSSDDGGFSWSDAVAVSPVFDSHLGWPNQSKLGDYYHMVSDELGADLIWAATFNGEQDVYFTRLGDRDCDSNGVADGDDLASGGARDCNGNGQPDRCEVAARPALDVDGNGILDACTPAPRRGGRRH